MTRIVFQHLNNRKIFKTAIASALILITLIIFAACSTKNSSPAAPFVKPVFKNKEAFTYRLSLPNGTKGSAVFKIAKDKKSPFGYVFTNTGNIPGFLDSIAVSRVRPDLTPLSTKVQIKNPGGLFRVNANYKKNKLQISYPKSEQSGRTIDIKTPTYDFGEFLMLLRNLDFKKGAVYTVREAWPSFGQVFNSKIKVTGIENIAVPAGTFRAYHVTHTFGPANGQGQAVYQSWYETAGRHRLVKHDNGRILYELK